MKLCLKTISCLSVCALLLIGFSVSSTLLLGRGPATYEEPIRQLAGGHDEDLNSVQTVKITIHRILEEDPIDIGSEADWYYAIGVSEDGTSWDGETSSVPIDTDQGDLTVDAFHYFPTQSNSLELFFAVLDEDVSADDVADISDYLGGGGSVTGDLTDPASYPGGAIFMGTYDLTSDTLTGDGYVVDGPWFKTSGSMDGSTGTDEDDATLWFSVEKVVTYPIEVRIHKIRAIDAMDVGTQADWYYEIAASHNGVDWQTQVSPEPIATDTDSLIVEESHTFQVESTSIHFRIVLFEDDLMGDGLADISGHSGGGMDNFPGGTPPRGAYFLSIFDWNTNSLDPGYDDYELDKNWYYRTSGDFDGSTDVDENDAELWFRVFRLPPKVLEYGPTGNSVNDGSSIGILFSARMDETSVESAFSITPLIAGDVQWNNDSTSFFLVPSSLLPCSSTYSVSLTAAAQAENGMPIESPVSWTFTVEDNGPPVAKAGEDETTELFKLVTFDASNSYDLTGEITSYEWDFGNGEMASGVKVQHTYYRAKDFQVNLTVTDNYGLSSTDSLTLHVEKGNYVPQNLNYDFAFYWDYFNVNVTTTLDMSLSVGFDQLVDLSLLDVHGLDAVKGEVLERNYTYAANQTGVTDDIGQTWKFVDLRMTVTERSYLRTLSGFAMRIDREIVQEFIGELSDGTWIEERHEAYEIDLTEPISVKLSDTQQSPTVMNLWHFTLLQYSKYQEVDGNVTVDAKGEMHPFLPFQRKHIVQPLGVKDLTIGGEVIRTYGVKHDFQTWGHDVTTVSDGLHPYDNQVVYNGLLLDEGWVEYACWYTDKRQTIPLEEIGFEMSDDGSGNPDYSTKEFLLSLRLTHYRDRITLTDGDNDDQYSTDFETTVRIYEPWANARYKLGGNDTHEVYLNFDLVYDVILRHEGHVVFSHDVSGEELDRTIQSQLLSSYDKFELYLQPHIDLSMQSIDLATEEVFEEYFYLELPVPTMEDVDGDGSHVNISDLTIYLWDNPALIWSHTGNDLAGLTHSPSTLSVTLAEVDILELLQKVSKHTCPTCALYLRIASWIFGLYLDLNLNVNAQFYYLVGTYTETNGTFDNGEDAYLQWFGFQSPVGEEALISDEMTVTAGPGKVVGTRLYRFVKSHVTASVFGSINLRAIVFPSSIFERELANIPILQGEERVGWSATHSFLGSYLYHEFEGHGDPPPVSEVLDMPEYTTSRSFDVFVEASDELGNITAVTLFYRLDSGAWTEYGDFTDDQLTFTAPSDGLFEFYSIAADDRGNVEEAPPTADAFTNVDTLPPNINAPPSIPEVDANSTLNWTGDDDMSGIDHYEVSVDGGPFENIGMNTSYPLGGLTEGTHYVKIRAYDKAGNYKEKKVRIGPEEPGLSLTDLWWLWVMIAAIVVILVVVIVIRRRSKESDES